MRNSIMDSISEFISGCPHIKPELPFYLDYVGAEDCYCIGTSPNYPFRKDILGNRIYTVTFDFAYRTKISDDKERGASMAFLEDFNRWVDEQNEAKIFPALKENEIGLSLSVIETGTLDEVSEDRITGVYLTRLQFIYKERKMNYGN